ncbi:hypothetical protein OG317_37090 [Streptomyces sp. NBC_01167]|uniref:hypothetical protein n=1 Tax=Streptomyces sp. NBC_01167 TaxID=2903756 RepID=UPI0038682116|nr:hypothetical protein OG317_37090 [Streptomyces sp. NBC_01167]
MATQTTMTGPVHLQEPLLEPSPVEGCGVCAALVKQREAARSRGNLSGVGDANVELRNHRHGEQI